MLKVVFCRVRPEKETRLREWLAELNSRAEEVRETFVNETVRAEQAYIISGSDGPLLVYVMEAADLSHGANAYAKSAHPIDLEHKQVMSECLVGTLKMPPLFDVSLP